MVIIKLTGTCLIMISAYLLGYSFVKRDVLAINELENFIICAEVIDSEIKTKRSNVYDSLTTACNKASNDNRELFLGFLKTRNEITDMSLNELWNDNLCMFKKHCLYNKSELNILEKFGILLGCGGADTQENNILLLKKSLNSEIEKRKMKVIKNRLATKLYLYIGLLLVIILL